MFEKDEFKDLIYLLEQNKIYYEIIPKFIKLSLKIPAINIYIDKYYLGTNYYIYSNKKFIKKINIVNK